MANFSDFVKEHKTQQFTTSGKTNEELDVTDKINRNLSLLLTNDLKRIDHLH